MFVVYVIAGVGLVIYGFSCYYSIYLFLKNSRKTRLTDRKNILQFYREHSMADLPQVTTQLPVFNEVQNVLYGGMPIQIGYCNGRNTTYNGFEYHKGSEINIAVTDFMLVLGHVWEIEDNRYFVGNEKVFYVQRGTAIEMYQTTLHLSPCRVTDEGFKDIVILPRGTNTPLDVKEKNGDSESTLLLQKNKWVLAHKDREPLVKQGAHIGLVGENRELKY